MTKKYELMKDDTIVINGVTLYGIRALEDFHGVKAGDIGGYVESELNLSHEGNAWIYNKACVFGDAQVYGNARIRNEVHVFGRARVYGEACVFGDALIYGYANVCDNAYVGDQARIHDYAQVCDNAEVQDSAEVCGNAVVNGFAEIVGDAKVSTSQDYVVFKNNWSSFRYFTYTHSNEMWSVGCFYGTGDELVEKAYNDSERSGKCYKQYVELVDTLYND